MFAWLFVLFVCLKINWEELKIGQREDGCVFISLLDVCRVRTHVTMSVLGMIHIHFGMKQQMH